MIPQIPKTFLKLLSASWFKSHGFTTKTSGVEFINNNPSIINEMIKRDEEIVEKNEMVVAFSSKKTSIKK